MKQRSIQFFLKLCIPLLFHGLLLFPLFAGEITRVQRAGDGWVYAATEKRGVLFSRDNGASWRERSKGLPKKQVWPFDGEDYRRITDIAVDRGNRDRLAVTTSTGLFLSEDGGREWKRVRLSEPVKSSNYYTSVAFDSEEGLVYLGTSFNGLFVSSDGGGSWRKLGEYLDTLYQGAGFYKEISDICVSDSGKVYILNTFDDLVYVYNPGDGIQATIDIPEGEHRIEQISRYSGGAAKGEALEFHGRRERLVYSVDSGQWRSLPALLWKTQNPQEGVEKEGGGEGKRAIYLNAYNAYGSRLESHLAFMKEHGFNALVVDVKDDLGRLTYATDLRQHRSYGAARDLFDLEKLVERAHAEGMAVIGRMVIFKDKVLYHAKENEYALWDPKHDAPWGHMVEQEHPETGEKEYVQREYWVDPFSEEVWDYNIAVAEELQRIGVDEVQFDYIRFPSDGAVNHIRYRHRRSGMNKTEALESFFRKVRRSVSIPISVDLYGFNSWYRMGNWIGQDIEMLSHYADVICPMFYPSHFPSSFLSDNDYVERAYRLYREGTHRARVITQGRSKIRPYVQAFLMGRELSMEEPEYQHYLNRQIEGTYRGGGSGYTLWNNVNRYYMVNSRVSELNGKSKEEPETDT